MLLPLKMSLCLRLLKWCLLEMMVMRYLRLIRLHPSQLGVRKTQDPVWKDHTPIYQYFYLFISLFFFFAVIIDDQTVAVPFSLTAVRVGTRLLLEAVWKVLQAEKLLPVVFYVNLGMKEQVERGSVAVRTHYCYIYHRTT